MPTSSRFSVFLRLLLPSTHHNRPTPDGHRQIFALR
jgi:hypothetical protein